MFFRKPKPIGPVDFLIVGLGNPGKKYEGTRHNAGFMAIDVLANRLGVKLDRLKYKSLCCQVELGDKRCLLMKPQTFMNNSGEAVQEAARFYKIPAERVLVLFDDISLPPGKLRIRRKGSDGGHNGIKSIIYLLNSDQFPRVKIGVGKKPHPDYDLASWVLSGFSKPDQQLMLEAYDKAADAVELLVKGETDKAMNLYNG
ncbi:aminoacyl-tRNA hydrolase [Solibaculum mannosilyticum]|uniref:Peptidyl-tRNA hydrolase n=1 Tax=Solibaculum mannosilyticum TaxID=2780922 RepID=A0A7I8CYC2_9FIRM|nr:aminoacyl-tRNA hydrolase [Solibaculum mannosilyticum]MCO7137095.1 aminoacyl-tRNA hydrolase [[Clostridium] leptum]BCI59480.1 peptidyl-tRNA hydrolase [Solibaculum mannosilyticum]CZT55260.1 Peptidyl-tRNA hydrolase [Eubacteriaceae bacterium CHKCI005]